MKWIIQLFCTVGYQSIQEQVGFDFNPLSVPPSSIHGVTFTKYGPKTQCNDIIDPIFVSIFSNQSVWMDTFILIYTLKIYNLLLILWHTVPGSLLCRILYIKIKPVAICSKICSVRFSAADRYYLRSIVSVSPPVPSQSLPFIGYFRRNPEQHLKKKTGHRWIHILEHSTVCTRNVIWGREKKRKKWGGWWVEEREHNEI